MYVKHLHLHRCFIPLHCLLIVSCVASSSPVAISTSVGDKAVLPCSWKSELDGINVPVCHIQWQTPADTVFEQKGAQRWEANEFKGRVEVPEEKLDQGDCSLILTDVQYADVGLYESFVVVDGARMNQRVFIQSVRLIVHDHKSKQSEDLGNDLVLKLHTPAAVRVVTQRRNTSEWEELWMRGKENVVERLEEREGEELVLRNFRREDEGTYKVLDAQGLVVSTVQIKVKKVSQIMKVPQRQDRQMMPVGSSHANRPSCPLTTLIALLSPLLILLL